MRRGSLIAGLALGLLPAGGVAQEPAAEARSDASGLDLPVVSDTLENGLRVMALPRPGAPTASFVLRFGIGSVNEAPGQTGIAHLLEHLLFKGTTTIGTRSLAAERELFRAMDAAHDSLLAIGPEGRAEAGVGEAERERERLLRRIEMLEDSARAFTVSNEFDEILTGQGARSVNATTSHEATTYYMELPANRAELWFVMEADRMANPVFREFYAERDVVAEERRTRVEASPGGRLFEEFLAAAYRVHPYRVPVIGYMEDIVTHRRAEVAAYHERYYRPNNAVVAVVGDIDPIQVLEWARRYFGPIPPGDTPPAAPAAEPPQHEDRRVRVEFDAEPEVIIGWRVPGGYNADDPALAVLARVLAGGKTSRLHRRLVLEDRLTGSVSVSIGPGFLGPRLFTVGAQPLAGRETAEIERAVSEEIDRLIREGPTERELERVRIQLEAADVRRLRSNLGLAFQLVESVVYHGDWRETFRSGERIQSVEAADVQRVARRYLTGPRTVAELVKPDAEAGG